TAIPFPAPDPPVPLLYLPRDHGADGRKGRDHLLTGMLADHFRVSDHVRPEESELVGPPFSQGPPSHGAFVFPGLDEDPLGMAVAVALVLQLGDDPRQLRDPDVAAHVALRGHRD